MSRGAEGLEQAVDETLIRDLAKKVLRQTAPEELPLLRPASERYFADPEKALRTRRQEQEVFGFGTEAAIALLTPVVLTIVTDSLKSFASDLARRAGSHGVETVRISLRRLFRLGSVGTQEADAEVPSVTPDQLAVVRRSAFDRALELDLPESKANLLADALVGDLMMPDH